MSYKQFEKNYTGIIKPQVAYAEAKAKAEVDAGMFKNATFNKAYNRQLEQQHIANARKNAGAKW